MKNLQIENGNFTRIINPLIDNLIKVPFKGCEIQVALFIIRKTYGYNKTEDEISISQFCIGLQRSRQTIVNALHNLQLVNIVRLVKRGDSKISSNTWKINKYNETWKLVNLVRLVKHKWPTSLTSKRQLVLLARHTKDKLKTIQKTEGIHTPYSTPNALEENDLLDIATKYHVPIAFVKSKYDDMVLWAGEQPNRKKTKNRNWKLTLMRWVKDDAIKIATGQKRGGVFDARKII